jgi:hypothetical protein
MIDSIAVIDVDTHGAELPDDIRPKVLRDAAARIYKLDV